MKMQFKPALKKSILVVFWLISPPLFLVFSFIWKMPKIAERFVLTAIAPLTLMVIIIGFFQIQQYYYFHFERGSRTELEAKSGLKFPDYKTIEKRHFTFEPGFNGDFSMEFTIKLDTLHIRDFYKQIDQKIRDAEKEKEESSTIYWNAGEDGNYSFSHFDPVDEDDQTLNLEIDKKTAQVKISYGRM